MTVELLSCAQTRAADAFADKAGVSGATLMEAAGTAAVEAIAARFLRRPVSVLCGPGNNGGDGFVIARLLAARGWPVRVALLGARDALKGDARLMAERWAGEVAPLSPAATEDAALVVDAVFGAGLSRPVEGAVRETLEAAARGGAPVVAVDLPSGVDGDTGAVLGFAAPAALTVTFFRRKPGMLLFPGRALCGEVVVADIGIPPAALGAIGPDVMENAPLIWLSRLRAPAPDGHKYDRGHALIAGGAALSGGAARLAARAALRAGAGLVTLAAGADASRINAARLDAVMVREVEGADALAALFADKRLTAALFGPGAGADEQTRRKTLALLGAAPACVLDADALTAFAGAPEPLFKALRDGDMLTPHAGEFARLFPDLADAPSKLAAAREAAKRSGAVVVLKGADTVIAAPDGRAAINANAPAFLATAGAGDVLAGIATGLRAQGTEAFEAACAAVWMHGAAGAAAGPGLIAEDLPDALSTVWRALYEIAANGARTTGGGR